MMKNTKKLTIIICVLLCGLVFGAYFARGRHNATADSVHMLDFNKDLERAETDDDYRTTYEIFVHSFCDSNGDGIGDINGIRSKLDYIANLGIDAIWLTPIHPSSTYHKYDVDDYFAIDPSFGTMEDYESLIKKCHKKGIRLYLDLVLNHTSEDNAWFRAAADYLRELPSGWEPDSSYCKYYDYYNFTREPGDGFVPLEGTEWYYEARFWGEMPELNLSSSAVREEIRYIMDYWLSKGVDGFRLDAVTAYYTDDTGSNTEFLRFLKETANSIDPDCYIVGEAWSDRDTIAAMYASGVDSLFDFPFAGSDGTIARTLRGECTASDYVTDIMEAEGEYSGASQFYVDAPFYTNHDMDRSTSYYSYDDQAVIKMAYAMDLFMTGNAFVYYGEELGMNGAGRDENRRAPMYWSNDAGDADMCMAPPGMDEVKMTFPPAAEQMNDEVSIWRWFREVIRVRNALPAIARGTTENADNISDGTTAAFYRRSDTYGDLLIIMNISDQPVSKSLSSADGKLTLAAVLNTGEEGIDLNGNILTMPGFSIAVFKVK